ncbi:P-loop NTPase family protein, partial [Kitasatospora indigofera]
PEGAVVPKQPTAPPSESAGPRSATGPDGPEKEKKPKPVARWAGAQARRTGDGAKGIGELLAHWGSTADQSGEELRRRIVAGQLEAFTERRNELRSALARETKKVVRLEEEASDGGLTDAQRGQLTLTRESARRLEKALRDMTKVPFRAVRPTEKQIARARTFGRLRRGAVLVAGSIATVMAAVHAPQIGLLTLVAGTAMAWRTGSHPPRLTHRPIPDDLLIPELDPPAKHLTPENPGETPAAAVESVELFPGDTGKPFPIRTAADPATAAACVLRALVTEGLAIGSVTDVSQEHWGWRATAHLTKGKPAHLVAKLPDLDVLLGVRQGGVMAQPQAASAGSIVLRIITSDPFAQLPPHPVHAPRSNSILRPLTLGPSMDATPTQITLAGQNVMVIAVPGGGKSAVVRTLVDYITSCTDAVAIDIDPTGRGFGPLRPLAAVRAYSEEMIDEALDYAIRLAQERALQMGDDVDNWPVSDDSPAVFVVVDEHPQLTPKQKQKVIKLGRIGRKARVTVILLSQDATADVVGDAIADVFGIRIMLPSRKADVALVVGSDTAISEGWMPHRLTPSPGDFDLADAGCFYIIAPGLRDPILRKATFLDAATATLRVQERLAAGPAVIDTATAAEDEEEGKEPALPEILTVLLDVFAAENTELLTLDQLHPHLILADPGRWDRWHDKTERHRLMEIGKAFGAQFRRDGIELSTERLDELDGRPRGIRRDDLLAAIRHYRQPSTSSD